MLHYYSSVGREEVFLAGAKSPNMELGGSTMG